MSNLILPKNYISWSQMNCWLTNKARFRREYFENSGKLDTKYLRFGKGIAKLIEEGKHKELLPDLIVYDTPEYEIKCEVAGVPILSFLDSYNEIATPIVPANVFREYKTGTVPWDHVRVQQHDQLTFYATGLKWKKGKMPEYCDLDWIETKLEKVDAGDFWREKEGEINVTGRIIPFHREFDEREVERMEDLIVKSATEISEAYIKFIEEI